MSNLTPGWYADPDGVPGMRRYWDGQDWAVDREPDPAYSVGPIIPGQRPPGAAPLAPGTPVLSAASATSAGWHVVPPEELNPSAASAASASPWRGDGSAVPGSRSSRTGHPLWHFTPVNEPVRARKAESGSPVPEPPRPSSDARSTQDAAAASGSSPAVGSSATSGAATPGTSAQDEHQRWRPVQTPAAPAATGSGSGSGAAAASLAQTSEPPTVTDAAPAREPDRGASIASPGSHTKHDPKPAGDRPGRSSAPVKESRSRKGLVSSVLIGVLVVALAIGGTIWWKGRETAPAAEAPGNSSTPASAATSATPTDQTPSSSVFVGDVGPIPTSEITDAKCPISETADIAATPDPKTRRIASGGISFVAPDWEPLRNTDDAYIPTATGAQGVGFPTEESIRPIMVVGGVLSSETDTDQRRTAQRITLCAMQSRAKKTGLKLESAQITRTVPQAVSNNGGWLIAAQVKVSGRADLTAFDITTVVTGADITRRSFFMSVTPRPDYHSTANNAKSALDTLAAG